MPVFHLVALILGLAAMGGYLNQRFWKLPATIGNLVFALLLALVLFVLDRLKWVDLQHANIFVTQIDFPQLLLHGMLSTLLFAGALHINYRDLRRVGKSVALLATFGVVLSTFITGSLMWLAARFLGLPLDYIYALLFGALISPTDPIAVLAMLKNTHVSKNLYTKIGGESLFNDGMGIVVFVTLLGIALQGTVPPATDILLLLTRETLGGLGLGLLLGWVTCRLLRQIENYKVEVMLTLALVMGGYSLAEAVHVSAPLCIVAAGLLVGNHGRATVMSSHTRIHVDIFWDLLDEILNAVLFILMGFQILIIAITGTHLMFGGIAIIAVLLARFLSIALPITWMHWRRPVDRGTIRIMTWGGLRGGISIALALSLPESPQKTILLAATYIVVLFSVLVQGLTFRRVVKKIWKKL